VADRRHPLRRIGRPKPQSPSLCHPSWLVRRSKRLCGSGREERYALLGTWLKCQSSRDQGSLGLEQLLTVRTHTSIKRVLISPNVKKEDRAAMAVLVASGASANGPIELRSAGKGVLHDRLIVGEGFVDTIGSSINTVGRQHTTVLSPLPRQAADTMRELAEKW
jgi:hypothetical protein